MPLPLLAAATLTGLASEAAGPLLAAGGQLAAQAIDPAARAYRQQMRKDIDSLRQGKLGMSEAEKRTMLAGTQRSLQAQTAGLEAGLRRSAAAQGGFGRSGAQTAALGALGAQRAEALTDYAGKVDALSQQQAQQRFGQIMGRLKTQRDEAMRLGQAAVTGASGAAAQTTAAYKGLAAAKKAKLVADQAEALARQEERDRKAANAANVANRGTLVR
jgi:hypothetical protein